MPSEISCLSLLMLSTWTSIWSPIDDQFAGMIDAFGPAHLADVHQALDARLQLDEGTVAHDVDDLARVPAVDRDTSPRRSSQGLGVFCLRPRAIFSLSLSTAMIIDLQLLVDLDHFVRIVDAAPAHVGDVQQSVDAAQVDEGAEVGDVLDHALANLARLDLGEEFLLHFLALILDELAPADDDVAAGFVDLEDLALDGLADVIADVAAAGGYRPGWPAGRR